MTLAEWRERMESAKAAADALLKQAGDDGLTDEQQEQFDGYMATFEKSKQGYDNAVRLNKAGADLESAPSPQPAHPTPVEPPGANEPTGSPAAAPELPRIGGGIRHVKLTHFASPVVLSDGRTIQGEEAAYRSGRWLQARFFGNAEAAAWCRDNGVGRPYANLSEGSNTAGGYLVPEEALTSLIENTDEYGAMRRLADVVPMNRDTMTVPRVSTFISANAVGEGATYTNTDPVFDQVNLTARTWQCLVRVSTELAEDNAVNLAEFLNRDMARAFAYAEDDAGINGDGTSTYHGIYGIKGQFDANESYVGVHTASSGDDTFSEFLQADIDLTLANAPEYALPNARILCSSAFKNAVLGRLGHAGGGTNILTIREGLGAAYGGYPIVTSPRAPAGLSTDYSEAAVMYFGDFQRGVLFGDRREVRMQTLVERYADVGEIAFLATERFDINFHGSGDGTNAGPVVALMGD